MPIPEFNCPGKYFEQDKCTCASTETSITDYRELLKKYIQHVDDANYVSFIHEGTHYTTPLNEEEMAELGKLEAEFRENRYEDYK